MLYIGFKATLQGKIIFLTSTLPETNVAPENNLSQETIAFQPSSFRVLYLFQARVMEMTLGKKRNMSPGSMLFFILFVLFGPPNGSISL